MRRVWMSGLIILSGAIIAAGCSRSSGTVTVQCGSLESLASNAGYLNTPNFGLGTVVAVNIAKKRGTHITDLHVDDSMMSRQPLVESEDDHFETSFDIETSANVPAAMKGQIKALISDATVLSGKKMQRVSLSDAPTLANGSPSLVRTVKDLYAQHPSDVLVLLVTGVVNAESLKVDIKGAAETTTSASVMKYGDYDLTVSYKCADSIDRQSAGRPFPAFFKYVILRLDAANSKIVADYDSAVDIRHTDFANGFE